MTAHMSQRVGLARWVAIAVFVLASVLNYLDRQLLAAVAPTIKTEFHLSNAQYGQIISAFSLVYALATPLAGLFIDSVGLRLGSVVAVTLWSLAGAATGLAQSFRALMTSRVALAIGEAAGIPSATKASATYLEPRELGLGTASHSVGISAGSIAAPLLVASLVPRFGWQSVFFVTGLLGFLWVPAWLFTSRRIPAAEATKAAPLQIADVLRDRRLWGAALANALVMTLYSLWSNWTTIYFVQERHLTVVQANQQVAWIPPVFATLGGFFGGWLAFRFIAKRQDALRARIRFCWFIAPLLLITAVVPFVPSTGLAAIAMGASLFACLAIVNNLQMIPIDLFGAGRAAFTGSVLTCSFALMQTVMSPIIGSLVDNYGFAVVCLALSILPLIGVATMSLATKAASPIQMHESAVVG